MEFFCEEYLKKFLSSEFGADCATKYGLLKGGLNKQGKWTRPCPKVTMQATSKPTVASSIATGSETRSDRIPIQTPLCLLFPLFVSLSGLYRMNVDINNSESNMLQYNQL